MKRIPKINEKVWVKSICVDKPCTVKSINWIFVTVRPLHAREDKEVLIDEIEFIAPETLTGDEKKEIIKSIIREDILLEIPAFNRELATLNNLIKRYPNLEFWRQFNPGYRVRSLVWFFGGGADQMNNFYNSFLLDFKPKKTTIKGEKLGEDVQINKLESAKDFLKNESKAI